MFKFSQISLWEAPVVVQSYLIAALANLPIPSSLLPILLYQCRSLAVRRTSFQPRNHGSYHWSENTILTSHASKQGVWLSLVPRWSVYHSVIFGVWLYWPESNFLLCAWLPSNADWLQCIAIAGLSWPVLLPSCPRPGQALESLGPSQRPWP